jgi:hypothetical protein
MSRLVSGVITSARDRHKAFDRQRTPNGLLYRYLADYCDEVRGKVMQLDPSYGGLEETIVYQMPLADFDAGLALGPGRVVNDVVAIEPLGNAGRQMIPVSLISRGQRFASNGPAMAAWQEGTVLFLRAPAERWTSYGSIEVQVVSQFTDADVVALQNPAAILPLPDAASKMVADALAYFMARRGHNDPNLPPIDVDRFERDLEKSEQAFLQSVVHRNVGKTYFTADVMHRF